MGARKALAIVLAAAAIAAGAFYVGAYLFPHSRTPTISQAVSPSPPSGVTVFESFGIGLPEGVTVDDGAASAEASGAPANAVLDAATLAALEQPVSGRLVGQYAGPGETAGTIIVRVLDFSVIVTGDAGAPARRTLPRGVPVTLVVAERPVGAPSITLPEPGGTVQAQIRIEPARGDLPGRIVAVSIVVRGVKP